MDNSCCDWNLKQKRIASSVNASDKFDASKVPEHLKQPEIKNVHYSVFLYQIYSVQ